MIRQILLPTFYTVILFGTRVVDSKRIDNVEFQQANLFELPFGDEYFDHIFLSFVLEDIPNPIQALRKLKRVLKKMEL